MTLSASTPFDIHILVLMRLRRFLQDTYPELSAPLPKTVTAEEFEKIYRGNVAYQALERAMMLMQDLEELEKAFLHSEGAGR